MGNFLQSSSHYRYNNIHPIHSTCLNFCTNIRLPPFFRWWITKFKFSSYIGIIMVYHMNKYCNEHIRTCHGLGTTVHHKTIRKQNMYPYNYGVKSSVSMQKNTRRDCFCYNVYLLDMLYWISQNQYSFSKFCCTWCGFFSTCRYTLQHSVVHESLGLVQSTQMSIVILW